MIPACIGAGGKAVDVLGGPERVILEEADCGGGEVGPVAGDEAGAVVDDALAQRADAECGDGDAHGDGFGRGEAEGFRAVAGDDQHAGGAEHVQHGIIGDAGVDSDGRDAGGEGGEAVDVRRGDEGAEAGGGESGGDAGAPEGDDLGEAAIGLAGEDGVGGRCGVRGGRGEDAVRQAVRDGGAGAEGEEAGGGAGLVSADEDGGGAVAAEGGKAGFAPFPEELDLVVEPDDGEAWRWGEECCVVDGDGNVRGRGGGVGEEVDLGEVAGGGSGAGDGDGVAAGGQRGGEAQDGLFGAA